MTPRDLSFPVAVTWVGGRLVRAAVAGKGPLELATPPEFRGTDPGTWSPEDALVAAAASCFAVTYLAVAERWGVDVHELSVDGVGRMGVAAGGLGFRRIDLTASVVTDPVQEEAALEVAKRAERGCFVSAALAIPVGVETHVRAATPVA